MTTYSQSKRNLLLLAPVACFPFLLFSILFFFRSSSLKRAVADPGIYAAQSSPAVAALIGLPIQPGWPIRGKILSKSGSGNAHLQIPLSGSRSNGLLLEWTQQTQGKWHLCALSFRSNSTSEITLVDAITTHCQAE